MATQFNNAGTFVANSAITAFRLVSISSNRGVGLSATAGSVDGVAMVDAASGDYVTVQFLSLNGTLQGTLVGAPVTVGDTLVERLPQSFRPADSATRRWRGSRRRTRRN